MPSIPASDAASTGAKDVPQPGTVPIPPGTQHLILRTPNTDASLNNTARVQHEVAAAAIIRSSKSALLRSLVPEIYSWKNLDDGSAAESAWVLTEYKPGKTMNLDFPKLDFEQQKIILHQIAQIVKALQQETPIPETVTGYGGLTFNHAGDIVSGPTALPIGGPFASYQDLYRSMLREQLKLSDTSDVIAGWKESTLRHRLDKFAADGIDSVCAAALSSSAKTIIHGDLSKDFFHSFKGGLFF